MNDADARTLVGSVGGPTTPGTEIAYTDFYGASAGPSPDNVITSGQITTFYRGYSDGRALVAGGAIDTQVTPMGAGLSCARSRTNNTDFQIYLVGSGLGASYFSRVRVQIEGGDDRTFATADATYNGGAAGSTSSWFWSQGLVGVGNGQTWNVFWNPPVQAVFGAEPLMPVPPFSQPLNQETYRAYLIELVSTWSVRTSYVSRFLGWKLPAGATWASIRAQAYQVYLRQQRDQRS